MFGTTLVFIKGPVQFVFWHYKTVYRKLRISIHTGLLVEVVGTLPDSAS